MKRDLVRLASQARLTPAGLDLPATLPFDDWLELGRGLRLLEGAVQWWVGDWLNYGERRYGQKYTEAAAATGYAYDSLNAARWVAQRIEVVRRRTNLSWSHHKEVAGLDVPEQELLLDAAEAEGWSRNALRRRVKRHKRVLALRSEAEAGPACTVTDLDALACTGRKFATVYADPPWQYQNQASRASTDNHYDTMTVEEIAAVPVGRLAAADAHLHLWTTNGFLFEARRVMEAWGFEYKSAFVWAKPQLGIGNYWRVSHELCLFGTRGSAPFRDRGQRSWQEWPRTEHSAKPTEFYELIEAVSPSPYLELFARRIRRGWTSWGDALPRAALTGAASVPGLNGNGPPLTLGRVAGG
jgi:N6-adenosine-specific RNA methylase IME4